MEPFCNRLALEARAEIRAHQAKLITRADRYYLTAVALIFGTTLSVGAFSVWLQIAS